MPTSGRPTKRGSHEPRLAYISVDFALRGIGVKLRIHRGTREIGGTCVELESNGSRILLDLGLPLAAADPNAVSLPAVAGLSEPDPALRAIVLSHGHRDHWGLLPKARMDIPIVMGRATETIMRAAADFVPDGFAPKASAYLESGNRLELGPFSILPHLVDHSGFDAYALEIEATVGGYFILGTYARMAAREGCSRV